MARQYSEYSFNSTNPENFLFETHFSPINVFVTKIYPKQIIFIINGCLNVKMTLMSIFQNGDAKNDIKYYQF